MKNREEKAEKPRFCRFCDQATLLRDGENVLCRRYGVVNEEYVCRKFSYDPLKRLPAAPRVMPTLDTDNLL